MNKKLILFMGLLVFFSITLTSQAGVLVLPFQVYLPLVRHDPSPTSTNTPTPTQTFTPSPTPTITPTPSPTPTPVAAGGMKTYNGVRGDYFRLRITTANRGENVWFEFSVTNITDQPKDIGGLGAYWSPCTVVPDTGNCTQASWGDYILEPYTTLDPEDHLNINTAGTYSVRLGICFLASRTDCENNLSAWQALSDPITVTIR